MISFLGIDWGSRTVGLALASAQARLARPLPSLSNTPQLFDELKDLCQEHQVSQLVVGLPRNLEGEETAQSAEIRAWAKKLGQNLGLPVAFQDETLTSQSGPSTTPAKDDHARAAGIILQDYLEEEVKLTNE